MAIAENHGKGKAFTTLELIIAVAIVATLAAIAIPVTKKMIARGYASDCLNNLNNLASALTMYLAENNNQFPELAAGRMDKSEDVPTLDNTLIDYVDDPEIFRCKADDGNHFQNSGSSYFWNSALNGQHASNLDFLGVIRDPRGIPVIFDKENFHVGRGDEVNILYADGHVDKDVVLRVE